MTLQVVRKDSVESGTARPKSLPFFSLSLLLIQPFFKCEAVPEQKNLKEEGKAKILHNYLPAGNSFEWGCLRGRHSFLLSLACSFPTLFHVSKAFGIFPLNVNAAACWTVKCTVTHTAWNQDCIVRFRFSSLFNISKRSPRLNTENHLQ